MCVCAHAHKDAWKWNIPHCQTDKSWIKGIKVVQTNCEQPTPEKYVALKPVLFLKIVSEVCGYTEQRSADSFFLASLLFCLLLSFFLSFIFLSYFLATYCLVSQDRLRTRGIFGVTTIISNFCFGVEKLIIKIHGMLGQQLDHSDYFLALSFAGLVPQPRPTFTGKCRERTAR